MHSATTDRAHGVSPLNIKQLCEKANNSTSLQEDWRKKGASRQTIRWGSRALECVAMRLSLFPSLRPPAPPPDQHAEEEEMEGPPAGCLHAKSPICHLCPWCQTPILPLEPWLCVWMTLLLCVLVWSSRQLFDGMLYNVVFNKELRMFIEEEKSRTNMKVPNNPDIGNNAGAVI